MPYVLKTMIICIASRGNISYANSRTQGVLRYEIEDAWNSK